MTANKLVMWVLSIFSACIMLFMGWVGKTLTRLDKTVSEMTISQKYEIKSVWEHVNSNERQIKDLKRAFDAHRILAIKEDELEIEF